MYIYVCPSEDERTDVISPWAHERESSLARVVETVIETVGTVVETVVETVVNL